VLLLKSVAAGVGAAFLALVLFVLVLIVPQLRGMRSAGSGGIGAVSVNLFGPIALVVLAFVAGFVWMFRRG
jgi:hypothetical protein